MTHNRLQKVTRKALFLLMLVLFGSTSLLRADEFTVYDGTATNGYVPVYGFYSDAYLKSEMVYPASALADIEGTMINGMTFYATQASVDWGTNFQVFVAEVEDETISAFAGPAAGTVVYEGALSIVDNQMVVTFDEPYLYEGGNLLVGVYQTTQGTYITSTWYGESVTGASVQGYNYNSLDAVAATQRNFLPKTTFDYEAAGTRYTITAYADPEEAGTVTGARKYLENAECTLTATPNTGYYFINWTLEGVEVATTQSYTFTVTADATYVAHFGAYPTYEITVGSNPAQTGTITGAGTYYENDICTLFAMEWNNYIFNNWTKDGEVVSTSATYSFVVTEDAEYIANFVEYDMTTVYKDGPITNNQTPLWLNGLNYYQQNQFVMPAEDLTALKDKSIKGIRFYLNTSDVRTFDSEFIVYLTEYPSETINSFMNYQEATQVYQGLMYMGDNIMTIAFDTPYDYFGGNLLIGINNINPGTLNYYALFMGVDKRDASIYSASDNPNYFYPNQTNFLPKTTFFFDNEVAPAHNITAMVDPEGAGYVEGAGEYHEGQHCTLKANANPGYAFVNWTLDGEEVATTPTYTFTVTGDATYVAHYEESWISDVELTVYEGTNTNNIVPMYIGYFDAYTKSQFVIPAEDLSELAGGTINAIRYYSNNYNYTTNTPANVYLKEVDYTYISAYEDINSAQVVYTGLISTDANSEMLITFDTPYRYNGGNLLIGAENIAPGSWSSLSYYGTTVEGASIGGYNTSGTAYVSANQQNFIPKTTFYAEVNTQPVNLALTKYDMGHRPLNAWMKPFETALVNTGSATTIQYMYIDNEAFQLEGIETPFTLGTDEVYNFVVGLNADEVGKHSGTLYVYYGNDYQEATFDVTATAYIPVAGDVWETAIEVNELPYQATAPASIYKNYDIPGGNADANDAVYKVTVDEMTLLNVTTTGANSAVAVYAEDFYGEGGPDLDNTYEYSVPVAAAGDEFYEDFDNGLPEGWTTIDADGDGFDWVSSENPGQYHNAGINLAYTGHNGSYAYMISGSYANGISSALNPDNYLVTPGVNIADGSIFSFWACAQDSYYAAEHFGVAVSTDGMSFTMLDEWTMTAKGGSSIGNTPKGDTRGSRGQGNWYYYSVDLSEYANEFVFIAIRNFNCYDQFIINVDDVELSLGRNAIQSRDVVDGTVLNPGTYYVVVSSTTEEFPVSMSLGTVPAPVAAQIVYPANEATEVASNCIMQWQLGYYTQEMQVLYGTTNPPTDTLVAWTNELTGSAYVEGLEDNTVYYVQINESNSTGTTMGEVTSFTTHLTAPVLDEWVFTPTFVGDEVSFSWSAIDNEQFLYYNIYLNNELYTETAETSFSVDTLGYNVTDGYWFEVSAVYSIGESLRSDYFVCFMSGNGNIEGHIYEQDGETPIAGIDVVVSGTNEFGEEQVYEFMTDEEGFYNGVVHAGNYCVYGMNEEYQTAASCDNYVVYNETTTVDLIMAEEYTPVAYVNVVEDEGNANIEWGFEERSLQYFRVYRSNAYNYAYRELIADSVFDNTWVDEEWANMGMGAYRYGVSAMYEGNHEATRGVFTYGFEEDLEGWTNLVINEDGGVWIQSNENLGNYDYTEHAHTGTGFAMCYSYVDYVGAFNTDAFLVSPQMFVIEPSSSMNFWADNANDSYPENFSIWLSTAETPTSEADFVEIWSGGAKGTGSNNGGMLRKSNNRYDNWREHDIDLSEYAGQQVWIAFRDVNYDMYEVWIDDITITAGEAPQGLHESAITWSDIISKDMYLGEGEMSVTVTLNSGDSPAGAVVTITNTDENEALNFPVEPVTLDETGTYTWDNFRKGTYEIFVDMEGYLGTWGLYDIYEPFEVTFVMYEITQLVENLYVSPTGWARWDDGTRHYENYNVVLTDMEGEVVFTTDTEAMTMQLPVDELEPYADYTLGVANVYSSDTTQYTEYTWTYIPCDEYDGSASVVTTTLEEGNIVLWASVSGETYNLEFNLYDSYGDGWNGGYLTMVLSDGEEYYLTVNTGSYESYNFDIPSNLGARIVYTAGSWSNENYFEIKKDGLVEVTTNAGEMYTGWTYEFASNYALTMVMRDGEILDYVYAVSYLDAGVTEQHEYSIRIVYDDLAMSCEQVAEYKEQRTITATANPAGSAMINGVEEYSEVLLEGAMCYFMPEALDNYMFVNWTLDGEVVSETPVYAFEVTGDANYVANFVDMTNNWTVNPNDYENSMSVTAVLNIDYVEQESVFWEIGAFDAEGACRSSQFLVYAPQVDRYLAYMTVYGNGEENLTFRIYNHLTGAEPEDLLSYNKLAFVADEIVGTPFEPYAIDFLTVTSVDYSFISGWNWWSTNIELNYIEDGLGMLTDGLGENAIQISSQTAFTTYYAGYGWYGSLMSINNESMYRVQMANPAEFTFTGVIADPEDHPITLSTGWNQIGYLPAAEMTVNEALVNITPVQGDMVKTQKSYANYYEGYGWYGSLNTIKPGEGLMYKSTTAEPVTFTYPTANTGTKDMAMNLTGDDNHWTPDVYAYPENMSVMAVVEMNGVELESDDYELAAFVNGECRGSVQVIYAEPLDRYVAFLTVSGDEAANITFGLYNRTTGEESFATTTAAYSNDALLGNPGEPFVVRFSNSSDITIYPNPVAKGEQVRIMTTNDSKVRVEIVNALGSVVSSETVSSLSSGITAPVAAGVYTVRIISEGNNVKCQKLVVE